MSLCILTVLANLGWAIWQRTDVGWSIGCAVFVIIVAFIAAYLDFIDFEQARKDANASRTVNPYRDDR